MMSQRKIQLAADKKLQQLGLRGLFCRCGLAGVAQLSSAAGFQ
jgi:hypothetical protein